MVKKLMPVLGLGLLLAGCTSTRITNLTAKQAPRNDNGLYQVEAAMNSRQETVRWTSIRPSVIIGKDFYPMRYTPLMTNRWETLIPVPPGNNTVYYRFKFDYDYNVFGTAPKSDSKLSPIYKLQISDH